MADYTNFVRAACFSVEQTLRRDWSFIWTAAHPVLRAFNYAGTGWNKGFGIRGTKMLLPLAVADQSNPADGCTVAQETGTPMTANTVTGYFQAEYQFAHYRGNYVIRESDKKIMQSNESRGGFLDFVKQQALESFKNVISTDIITPTSAPTGTNTADATDAIQSLRYILANNNVVGGKDQALDTNWQAVLNTGTGPFLTDYVDQDMDTIDAKGRGRVDFMLAANASGGMVYQKFKAALASGERWTNTDFSRKAGLKNFVYADATVLLDNRNAAGELIGLSTPSWYVYMPDQPEVSAPQRLSLTDAWETVLTYWCALGCRDIGVNFRRTGIT